MQRKIYDICQEISDPYGDRKYTEYHHPIYAAAGKLRACFDPLCAEWNWHPMEEKLATIRLFLKFISFNELVESYCYSERREYVVQAVPDAIFLLASYLPEAADYYLKNPRCEDHARYRGYPTIERLVDKAEEIADKALGSCN